MKREIILYFIIFLTSSICWAESENAKEYFRRLMEYAHPTPEIYDEHYLPLVPLSVSTNSLLFYNTPLTVDEIGTFQMQNESSIAINPLNPKIIIASAVDYRDSSATWVYISTDGGRNWKNKNLKRPYPGWRSSNDPSVAFSYDGIGYVVYGGFGIMTDTGVLYGENGVFLARTTDNGNTWTPHIPIIVHRGQQTLDSTFEDKYYITVDNSLNSPYRGRLYVPWKRVIPRDSSTQIVLSYSTNHGDSWAVPIPISQRKSGTSEDTTFGQSFPLSAIGPNGEVYVVWNDGTESAIGFAKSINGGKTFSPPRHIVKYNPFGKTKFLSKQGYRHTVKGTVRAEAYPSLVCDYTSGPRSGYLYLCWSADSTPNVYFSRSTDGGETWSEPIIVHSETINDQFWPWIALDPTSGDIAIMYLDSRNDPDNLLVECFVSYSNDGGLNWIDRRVADASSNLRLNPFSDNSFAGDYSGCAFFSGKIFPSWVDMRNAIKNIYDSDVYTAYISINTPEPPNNFHAKIIPEEPNNILLSWEQPKNKVFGKPLDTNNTFYLFKRNGNFITKLDYATTQFLDTGLIQHNLYLYTISTLCDNDTSIELTTQAFPGGAKNPLPPLILSSLSDDSNRVILRIQIPALREDSTTPFVNLNSIILFDDTTKLAEIQSSPTDTGKIIELTYQVPEQGFYKFRAKIMDKYGNQSIFSNELQKYVGTITNIAETSLAFTFDVNSKKRFLRDNGWNYTTNFFHSEPSSITDSPVGNYPNRQILTLRLFPFKFGTSESVVISFWHTALIHRTDTGFVQLIDNRGNFLTLGKYNINSYPYVWDDKVLDKNDWINESFQINRNLLQANNLNPDELFLQFSLESGTLGTDDGWYIDDVLIYKGELEVFSNIEKKTTLFPNPCSNYIIVQNLPEKYKELQILNILGKEIEVPQVTINYENQNIIIRTSSLPDGSYFLQIKTIDGQIFRMIFVVFK